MFDCLDTLAPGSELGSLLETVDRDRLSGDELVSLMKARHRQISHLQAEFYSDVVAARTMQPASVSIWRPGVRR